MNRRLLTVLFVAFVIAGVCAFLVYKMVGNRLTAQKPSTTRIVAASTDIKLGAILTPSDVTTTEIAGPIPQGAITNPKDAIGRGAISEIYQGEPILESRLAAPGSGGGLAATIPDGMRAIAVKVDQVVGVAGFVTPGMRVDVIASGTPPGGAPNQGGTVSTTILQNIEVLSAGTDIQKDATGKPQQVQVVNLLVTPDQAETLSLAGNQGVKIQLVLRNPLDTKVNKVPVTAMSNLFGEAGQPVRRYGPRRARKQAPPVYSIEVINGSQRSQEQVGAAGGKH